MKNNPKTKAARAPSAVLFGRVASGNHLAAQNDEPELFSEAQLIEADLARNAAKAEPDYHRALELQQQRLGAVL